MLPPPDDTPTNGLGPIPSPEEFAERNATPSDGLGISPTSRLAAQLGDRLLALADRAWRIVGQAERTRREIQPDIVEAVLPCFRMLQHIDVVLHRFSEAMGIDETTGESPGDAGKA